MISIVFMNSTVLLSSSRVLMVEALTHFGKLLMTLLKGMPHNRHSCFTETHFIAISQSILTE